MSDLQSKLSNLREHIDSVDERLLELLRERAALVKQVGETKQENGITGSYINPKREALMLKRLLEKMQETPYPPEAIVSLWRTLIGASTAMESPLRLAIHQQGSLVPYMLAREYFGSFIPATMLTDSDDLLAALEDDPHIVGVLNPTGSGEVKNPWWLRMCQLEKTPYIFACLPFVQKTSVQSVPFLAIAQVNVEETGDDISYITAIFSGEMPAIGNIIATCNIGEAGSAALLRIPGFFAEDSENFANLRHALGDSLYEIHFLGAHASPYLIN